MNDYYSLSQEDSDAAREYRKDVESRWERPEWYMIEAAFKDGICHAKGIQYDFLNDSDKDFIRSAIITNSKKLQMLQKS